MILNIKEKIMTKEIHKIHIENGNISASFRAYSITTYKFVVKTPCVIGTRNVQKNDIEHQAILN